MSLWTLKTKSVIKFTTTMLEKFGQNDPHNSNHFYGKPSNIYYKSIVKLTKSSINLTRNRYAQSIVKLAMIFSLFTTFLANRILYVVIFTWIFQKFTRDFENFTVLLTNLSWLFIGLGNSM